MSVAEIESGRSVGLAVTQGGEEKPRPEARPPVSRQELAATAPVVVTGDEADAADAREKFIPITRTALLERLTHPSAWPKGVAGEARRFFRYLDFWRQQSYNARLLELEQLYETFSPDSDLLITRKYTEQELAAMQARLVARITKLLKQANYTRIDPARVEIILTRESHYGLDLHVDMDAFEEILIFTRGAASKTEKRRDKRKLYLRHEEFEVPIYQRLFILFKLKPEKIRLREIMAREQCDPKEARKILRKLRGMLAPGVSDDRIYMKLFKNIPRADLEMCFPNTKVKFRLFDKIKLGISAGGGLGMGVVGTASKIAVATNPIALAGAVLGLSGVAFRQATNFMNQRQRYMVTMAQNLYFHALADNRGVLTLMANRAAEEDIKEEMLLYSVLAKEVVRRRDLRDIDGAIEQYLLSSFDVNVDFDLDDALDRLIEDGIVRERPDGVLETLAPAAAAAHIDALWDSYLDHLPDVALPEGHEFDGDTGADVI